MERVASWTRHLSLLVCLLKLIAGRRGTEWTEVDRRLTNRYVVMTVGLGIAVLVVLSVLPPPRWSWVIAVVALYLVGELAAFMWRWLFVDKGPVLFMERSLGLFLINVVGIVVFFGVAFLGLGCLKVQGSMPGWTAAYSSFRVFTTLGTENLCEHWLCEALTIGESAMTFLITVVILGGVAGAVIGRRDPR